MGINKKKKKTVGYVRYSLADKDSIELQKTLMQEYCDKHSYKIAKFFTDAGYSGVDLERPALQKMLKDVADGEVERIVCADVGRLTKNKVDAHLMEKVFVSNNVAFSFLSGQCYYDLYRDDVRDHYHWKKSSALLENLVGGKYPLVYQVASSCGKKLSAKKPNTRRRYRHNSNVDRSHQG